MLIKAIFLIAMVVFFFFTGWKVLSRSATSRELDRKRNALEEKRMVARETKELREIEDEIRSLEGEDEKEAVVASEPEEVTSTDDVSERTDNS